MHVFSPPNSRRVAETGPLKVRVNDEVMPPGVASLLGDRLANSRKRFVGPVNRVICRQIDVQPSSPFLADGWEVSIDSGGSIEIDISAYGTDCITVFDPAENREYPQGAARDGGTLEYVFESDEKRGSKDGDP